MTGTIRAGLLAVPAEVLAGAPATPAAGSDAVTVAGDA